MLLYGTDRNIFRMGGEETVQEETANAPKEADYKTTIIIIFGYWFFFHFTSMMLSGSCWGQVGKHLGDFELLLLNFGPEC